MDGRRTALVVETHGAVREVLSAMLAYHGYVVTAVEPGPAAVAALRACAVPPSVALVGVGESGLLGPAAVLALRSLDPLLPCLLITGGHPITADEARACGAVGTLPKPMTLTGLGLAVQAAARDRFAVNENA